MTILAVETATRAGSLALADGELVASAAGTTGRTHAERLPREAIDFLAQQGRTLHDVSLFAVIAGPGSFTGLRVGMAAVQGLALAAGRQVVAVSTLEAMADGWLAETGHAGTSIVVASMDADRGEWYFGAWIAVGPTPIDACEVLVIPRVGTPAELQQAFAAFPPALPVVVIGPLNVPLGPLVGQLGSRLLLADASRVSLAAAAARTAARRPDLAASPHALRPLYLRRPDAELARERTQTAAPPPETFVITQLAPHDDLSAVEALQRRAFTNAWGAEALRWELANTDVARLYALHEPGGGLVAYCACWMIFDELHINSLAVDETWRRRGIARRLLDRVFRDAVAAGARSATLEVRQSNQAARVLYERLGFSVEAVRRDYYQEPREDALILWNRRLAESAP